MTPQSSVFAELNVIKSNNAKCLEEFELLYNGELAGIESLYELAKENFENVLQDFLSRTIGDRACDSLRGVARENVISISFDNPDPLSVLKEIVYLHRDHLEEGL